MLRKIVMTSVCFLFIAMVSAPTAPASAEKNNCENKEISVSNQVAANLWYKQDGSTCSPLKKYRIVAVEPGEYFQVFSDMTCETNYCKDAISYKDIRTYDSNGDCRVRILSGCIISDM